MPAAKKTRTTARTTAKRAVRNPVASPRHRIFTMAFARIYPAWLNKVERKGRTRRELDQVIGWLTGYTPAALRKWTQGDADLGGFIDHCPAFNPAAEQIRGTVCGVRVEEIQEPSMRRLRQLDKLVDELAQGKAIEKILRQ